MRVIDHTDSHWVSRYNRHSRTNGAFTYSQDICKWHLPVWDRLLGSDDVVATCGKFPDATIQYLHERTHVELSDKTRLFVTTYRDLAESLGSRGLWIPNVIDSSILPDHRPEKEWVYYGNLIGPKRTAFERLTNIRCDVVSGVSDQQQALRIVSQYKYGIGVGRCALEMMSMGLKVMIFGKDFGGGIFSEIDFQRQQEANFNGNVVTGSHSVNDMIGRIDQTVSFPSSFQKLMPEIERRIVEAWQKVA